MVTTFPLRDGRSIPAIGFGVYKVDDAEASAAVGLALEAGYRHVDTAEMYGNERGVGQAIRASRLDRDDVFVTTKVWNDHQGRDATLRAFDASLDRLGLDAVDLYLIHWPAAANDRYVETWRTLVEAPGVRPGAQHRGLELPGAAPRTHHRRDGRGPGAQPGRAAPVVATARGSSPSTRSTASSPGRGRPSAADASSTNRSSPASPPRTG